MPIDEVKFGELIGTVGALVTAVSDMKAAIIPALNAQQQDMAEHKEKDIIIYGKVANLADWKDGTATEPGAKKQLNDLVNGKGKFVAFVAGVTVMGGMAGHKISEGISLLWGALK